METVDGIIKTLVAGDKVTMAEILLLCKKCIQVLKIQPMLLELKPPVNILGDIHGQFRDLLRIMKKVGFPPYANYLLLGDYIDRGTHSIEVICLLMAYKVKYPEKFFILRGNHEDDSICRTGGFLSECRNRFPSGGLQIWDAVCKVFTWLPLMALINGRIICIHGGLSPNLSSLDQVRMIKRPLLSLHSGIACDLVWSDPRENQKKDFVDNSDRGISYCYSSDYVKRFLRTFDLDLIVRAHECKDNGYQFFGGQSLVTLFSAPNYCGRSNKAAVLSVDEQLVCTFKTFGSKFFKHRQK